MNRLSLVYVGNIICHFYNLHKFIYLSLYHDQIRVMHISLQKLHANLMAYRRIWHHVKSKFSKALCTSYILLHYTSFVEMKSAMNLDCFKIRVQIWWGSKKYIISCLTNIFWLDSRKSVANRFQQITKVFFELQWIFNT